MPSSFSFSRLALVGLVVLPLVGAGCGSSGVSVDTNTNTINSNDRNGNSFSAGDGATIPANFPSDFPKYAGATTKLAYTENNGKSGSLVQETSDSIEQVQASVEAQMQANGFLKNDLFGATPTLSVLSFSKGTIRYQVNIARQNTITQIQSVRVEQ